MITSVDDLSPAMRRMLEIQQDRYFAAGGDHESITRVETQSQNFKVLAIHTGLSVEEIQFLIEVQRVGVADLVSKLGCNLDSIVSSVATSMFELGHIYATEQLSKEAQGA